MKNDRRAFLIAAGAMMAGALLPAHAAAQPEVQQAGTLRVAVYADYAPFSARGKGIDVALAQSLAERLGLRAEIVEFPADENMNDDLRNMVWKGHYLGHRPADVMMHVPVDAQFAAQNDKVAIFGPYHLETIAIARNPERVPSVAGSAAVAFEVFTREKIGVELDTHASDFMLHVMNGRLRDNVVHFRSVAEAAAAMAKGEVSAVMAPRSQLEGALKEHKQFAIDTLTMPELRVKGWPLGMAVKADHKELAAALSEALADIQRSGELARIFTTHGVTHRVP
ncbi:substrate-binding periplasmic protein [Aromatoleum petrolei]|uniref:Transporter substrate-binding domain-containing protein n=1 Tax=Aromatoleum petrolei TaxID=76116 RepID=A0ABX1MVK7_9RHOO|nr:transporter substrate-binding domain-containing protein [Aromatoleum petrolei]NMF89127.1 transporter substrate-binding domain-containing protein [Aromatoleum petrolei]QTQ38279.1 ABC transporter, substrate-binding protein [Aromatoleum petrolei]